MQPTFGTGTRMSNELWMENWSYNESDHWANKANCKGKAFELFEYQEKDSPLAKGMSFQERIEFNAANFELAAEICIECPVFFQCKSSATEDDRRWTVRGGEPPARFTHERSMGENAGTARTCQRGHYIPAGGRCKACKQDARRRARANVKLASTPEGV